MKKSDVELRCDMRRACENPVTHISRRGWVYCTIHSGSYEGDRRMLKSEIATLEAGGTISYERRPM